MSRSMKCAVATCLALVLSPIAVSANIACEENFFSDVTCTGTTVVATSTQTTATACRDFCVAEATGAQECCKWIEGTQSCTLFDTWSDSGGVAGEMALYCASNFFTASPTQSPIQAPTQSPTQAPTTSPTASPTTPCSTIVQTFSLSESPAVCGYGSSGKSKSSAWSSWSTASSGKRAATAQCYADGLGHALVDAFSSASGLPGAVDGILTMNDIVDSITVVGADGPSDSTRTGVTVVVEYKPESPISHVEFAAAGELFATGAAATLEFCECSSQVSVTHSSLMYDIESSRGSTKKGKSSKKCKGGYKTPKSKKEKKSGFLMAISEHATPSNAAVASGFMATVALAGVALARRARARQGYNIIGEEATPL